MSRFTKEEDDQLIDTVARIPCLWNREAPDFKNTAKREAKWAKVSKTLKKAESDCRRRWKSIRDHHKRQLREEKLATGVSAKKKKRSVYWDRLSFLTSAGEAASAEALQNPPPSPIPTPPLPLPLTPPSTLPPSAEEDPEILLHLQMQDRAPPPKRPKGPGKPSRTPSPEDDVDLFFKTMAATVKKFSPMHIINAKRKIFEIICNIEMLNYESRFCEADTPAHAPEPYSRESNSPAPSLSSSCSFDKSDYKPDLRSYCVTELLSLDSEST